MPFWTRFIDSDDIKHVRHTKIKAPTVIQTLTVAVNVAKVRDPIRDLGNLQTLQTKDS